jgi:glycerol-3-phosphate acyltransferase PlsY
MVMPLAILLIVAASYLFGSIPTGYLLMRLFRHQDIRSFGSGNIGATNVLLDVLKGAASVLLGGLLAAALMPAMPHRDAQALAALCAVLGHMFPIWLRFRGGKGVATGFGVFLVAAPWAALAAIGLFALVFAFTRYVSLASIVGAASFPFFAVLIIAKHHQNIRRLLAGTESRIGAKKPA